MARVMVPKSFAPLPAASTPRGLTELRDYIHQTLGIYYPDEQIHQLARRLTGRMTALDLPEFDDYLEMIRSSGSADEFYRLTDVVTNNETAYLSGESQLRALADQLVPQLLAAAEERGETSIRIWSVGCSTGDEPYSLAILLSEKLGPEATARVELVASDVSVPVLVRARLGRYRRHTLQLLTPSLLDRYFRRLGEDAYEVRREIKRMVRYVWANVIDDTQPAPLGLFDAILCRGVITRFSEASRRQALGVLYRSLRPGGYLFLGEHDRCPEAAQAFDPVSMDAGCCYQRRAARVADP